MSDDRPEGGAAPAVIDRRIGRRRQRIWRGTLSTEDLVARLLTDPILKGVPEEDVRALVAACETEDIALGTVILRQGDPSKGLYLLTKGRVRIVDDSDPSAPVTLVSRDPGAVFGDRGLILDTPIGASVRAASRVEVLRLAPEGFRALVRKRPIIVDCMAAAIARYDQFNMLRRVPILRSLPEEAIYALLDSAERVEVPQGAPLAEEGVADDGVWLIREGRFRATLRDIETGAPTPVGQVRAGTFHGLRGLMVPDAPPVTLTADTPSVALRWPGEVFRTHVSATPEAMALLRQTADLEAQRIETLSGVTAQDEDRPKPKATTRQAPVQARQGRRSYTIWPSRDKDEDGMAALRTAAAYLGLELPEASNVTGAGADPTKLTMLAIRAEEIGLVSRLMRAPLARLSTPLIPFLFEGPDGRIKTALRLDRRSLTYADPGTQTLVTVPRAEAADWWAGEALTLGIVPDFAGVGSAKASMVTRFLPMLRPHRGALIQLAALAILGMLLGLAMPLATRTIIDHVLVFEDRYLLILMLAAIVSASVVSMASDAASEFLTIRAMNLMSASLMARFLSHTLAVPLDQLQTWRSGDLSARFEENESIFDTAIEVLSSFVFDVLSVVVFGIALFLLVPNLALLVMAIALLIGTIMILASKRLRQLEIMEFDAGRDLQSHIIETFDGIESLKFAGREDAATREGVGLMQRSAHVAIMGARFSFRLGILIEGLSAIASLAVLAIGGQMVVNGEMTAGTLVAFTGMVGGVMGPLQSLAGIYDDLQELRVSFERVNDILDLPREPGGTASAPRLSGAIRFENLSFEYEAGQPVLSNVTLDIPAGTKVAFVGPSGSGKTTLVRMVNRLLNPTSGRVLLDDLDTSLVEPASLRRQIGTVEQVPHIFSGTIRENIAKAFPEMPLERIAKAARLTGAADFVEKMPMAYATKVGEGGRSLSGGQSQRLVIARAIAGDPRILILDEATSALDMESEEAVQRALDSAMAGRTVIAVAHRLSTIRNADMIVVLEKGRVVETGTHDDLMAQDGLYRTLVEAGQDGLDEDNEEALEDG